MIETQEGQDGVRVLRMAHGKASALDLEFLLALAEAFRAAGGEARALVLTGTGRIFSAGVDLVRLRDGGDAYLDRFLPALDDALTVLFALPIPTVAAINGHAIAGGWILAAACEHRFMAEGTGRVGVPELRVGVPFPLPGVEILRAATPAGRLDSLLLTGDTHPAEIALALGLVHAVLPADDLLPTATAHAAALAGLPPASYARSKADARAPHLERIARDGPAAATEIRRIWGTEDVRAAVARYVESTLGKR